MSALLELPLMLVLEELLWEPLAEVSLEPPSMLVLEALSQEPLAEVSLTKVLLK